MKKGTRFFLRTIILSAILVLGTFLAIVVDYNAYMKNLELNPRQTISWIMKRVADGSCSKVPLPLHNKVVFRKNENFEAMYVALSPDSTAAAKELSRLKQKGYCLRGFYYIAEETVYLCEEISTREDYVHEVVHHVIRSVRKYHPGCKAVQEKYFSRDQDFWQELAAISLAEKYVLEHSWSAQLLSCLGLRHIVLL